MTNGTISALLPAGLTDVLPPRAAFEAATVERLMAAFALFGYERVKSPLIEFEETMLAGSAAALTTDTFRLMDPVSQRMLALRPDVTMQMARIATTRLAHWPRPLRLGYAGQVMRVRGSELRPERQMGQVGAEMIGTGATPAGATAADVEVIVMAATSLAELGVGGLSVDLDLPTLVPAVLAGRTIEPEASARLRVALDRKDVAAVQAEAAAIGDDMADILARLIGASGPADTALAKLMTIDLPVAAAAERQMLADVYTRLRAAAPDLPLTVDAVENRGFEYHKGVAFALFALGVPGELGRGGRYVTPGGEAATGVTLFMEPVLAALPMPPPALKLLLPADAPHEAGRRLRREGWTVIAALDAVADLAAEARRLGCSHILDGGTVRPVTPVRAGETAPHASE
jgi:ATP phosphoribosyltransferase involved in histidine biosynthesis